MSPTPNTARCAEVELIPLLAVDALPLSERLKTQAHVESCPQCQQELEALRRVTDSFAAWPTDVLRPSPALWGRVAARIAAETGEAPVLASSTERLEPEWEEKAAGIWCKLLTTDNVYGRVAMLVRLGPGVEYPPHMHAEFEELHLLDGELWIDDRKLCAGDFNRAEPGTTDSRVRTETGCTCFLTTSFQDTLV